MRRSSIIILMAGLVVLAMACNREKFLLPVSGDSTGMNCLKPEDEKGKPFKSIADMEEQLGLVAVAVPEGYVPDLYGIIAYDTVVLLRLPNGNNPIFLGNGNPIKVEAYGYTSNRPNGGTVEEFTNRSSTSMTAGGETVIACGGEGSNCKVWQDAQGIHVRFKKIQ